MARLRAIEDYSQRPPQEFTTRNAALAHARRNAVNADADAAINAAGKWCGVAVLRSDQDWMVPHLRERGLATRFKQATEK